MRLFSLLLLASVLGAAPDGVAELRAKIDELREDAPAWRGIPWGDSLAEGVREAREKKRPLLLWIFIDRPADDARC